MPSPSGAASFTGPGCGASTPVLVWLNHLLADGDANTAVTQRLWTVDAVAEGAGFDDGAAAKTATVPPGAHDPSSWEWEACSW